ncbi:MAG: hypothetical protein ACYS9Y_01500 [Planctomycetota bacterium]|jgi:hypothetical protein
MLLKVINILVILTVIVLSLAIFGNSMTKVSGHDEQMYCTAGALLADGKMIYKDFSYVAQLPYHPLLCAAVFKMFDTTYYLLTARILSSLCDILIVVCIIGIYYRVFTSFGIEGRLLGMAGAFLYLFNSYVDYANGFAWNHDAVVLCVCLSFWIFISTDFADKSKYLRIAAIGTLLTLATFMRITTALVQLVFFTALLGCPAESIKQRFKNILPFLIATTIVLIWPVWTIISAPQAFLLNIFRIPMLNSNWLHETGMAHNKFNLTLSALTMPGYPQLFVIAVYLYAAMACCGRKLKMINAQNALLATLLALTFFIIAFIPPTMWKQYLAVPVPFIIISFSYPLFYLRKLTVNGKMKLGFKIAGILIAICTFVSVYSHLFVLDRIPKVFNPQGWVPLRTHRLSEDIAQRIKEPKLILTLAPLYALEGKCDIYPEFSAGSFVYRIADSMTSDERKAVHAVGPEMLKQLLEQRQPSAVILNVEFKSLEMPLFETAVLPGGESKWERINYTNGLVVYLKR